VKGFWKDSGWFSKAVEIFGEAVATSNFLPYIPVSIHPGVERGEAVVICKRIHTCVTFDLAVDAKDGEF
jgi:hypothetical protein